MASIAAADRLNAQAPAQGIADPSRRQVALPRLAPTQHPPLPGSPSLYWLLPEASASRASAVAPSQDETAKRFARGAGLIAGGDFSAGLPLVSGIDLAGSPLAGYARYYEGLALMGLGRPVEAEAAFAAGDSQKPQGYLKQAIPMRLAEAAMARRDPKDAVKLLDDLTDDKVLAPEDIWLRLARAAELASDTDRALAAYRRVYYEYPLSAQAVDAQAGIERLETTANLAPGRFKQEMARAERLFSARRWAQSRAGFAAMARSATLADDRDLIALRLAECDYYLDRARAAKDALRPLLPESSRKAEARYFDLMATRALGNKDDYVAMARAMAVDFPTSSWTEDTLNALASFYLVENDDQAADEAFRGLYRRFPQGRFAERAAWKIGWWAYKGGRFVEAAETFERAAGAFPRADLRPAWLYWSGRARDQAGDSPTANTRYRLAVTDYQNSYYGRLAAKLLADRREPPVSASVTNAAVAALSPLVPSDALVRQLVGLKLYDDALRELQYAQRAWADSPAIQATIAWIRHEQGLEQVATERFQNLRGAITLMKRAYPQYLAAGGERLPPEVLRIMFPLDYWPLISKYAAANDLDPYLIAALVAQESTFTADIRSSANAYGLMQIIPAAGRQYAKKAGFARYSQSLLTQPEANVRMGTVYFKDLTDRFGGAHFALAGYNAGPHRVSRWLSERPSVAQDEFIDDIPFPETQNYVKRVLGTAEDYRRLYGPGGPLTPVAAPPAAAGPKAAAPGKPGPSTPEKKPAPRRPRRR